MGPGLTRIFLFGKSPQNSSEPVLIFLSSVPYVFCLYIIKQSLDGVGGWGEVYPSFFFDFWHFFNFAKPPTSLIMGATQRIRNDHNWEHKERYP